MQAAQSGSAQLSPVDVLIVSLGSTHGLRTADEQLQESLRRAGANVTIARAIAPTERPTMALTDLSWARAVRTAAVRALAQLEPSRPRAIIYSSTTAALLWPLPGAIRFDAPSASNRPGRHGLWQRPLERRRLAQAPLLLPWSRAALCEAPRSTTVEGHALTLPVAVDASGAPEPVRDIAAITYAANPTKKGLERVLEAWRRVRAAHDLSPTEELVVAGAPARALERAGLMAPEEGVRVVGALPREDYRALLRKARLFVCAPRREDYGIAQLEALADGCQLVTTPAPGPYVALEIARALDGRLVDEHLEAALSIALREPREGYAASARTALAPFTTAAVDRLVSDQLLPRLLGRAPR
jgi:glycosyltransferase involved in cell wall biosynthesis